VITPGEYAYVTSVWDTMADNTCWMSAFYAILQGKVNPSGGPFPFHGGQKCYACDCTRVVGYRDRRPEGGEREVACARHADPTIPVYEACIYCDGKIRRGSVSIDGDFAHKKCHHQVCTDTFPGDAAHGV
jgi:hypothetical protein